MGAKVELQKMPRKPSFHATEEVPAQVQVEATFILR